MPFRSKQQMKACYATNGFGGKIDCEEWQKDTPKKLPKRVKKKKEEGGEIPSTNFERRINSSRALKNNDGTSSTHKMMSFEADGKYYAAPTIIEQAGELMELDQNAAIEYALKNKEYKQFNSEAEAQGYANGGYKKRGFRRFMEMGGITDPILSTVSERKPTKQEMRDDPEFYMPTMHAGNYGKYSGITNKRGMFSQFDALLTNVNYMKNNWSDQSDTPSNVYRPENAHIAANYKNDVIPMAKKGGKMWAGGWPIPNPNPDDTWTNFPQTLSKERNPPTNPYQQLPTNENIDNVSRIMSRSLADPQKQLLSKDNTPYALANGPEMNSYDNTTNMPKKKRIDPFFLLRGATSALAWLGEKKNRNRQDQYKMNQYSSMGQLDPVNINDFQPNPYNQYAKKGGNIYKEEGGDADLAFLFEDDDDEVRGAPVTAPTAPPEQEEEQQASNMEGILEAERQYNMAMEIAMGDMPARTRRYGSRAEQAVERPNANPYVGDIVSDGQYGASNVGPYGRQIYGELAQDLGYKPVANSIYRDPKQQEKLVRQGVGAKNSWHLTGNAVDIKPKDWNNLPDNKKAEYKAKYDVKYHNNHYHLEPK